MLCPPTEKRSRGRPRTRPIKVKGPRGRPRTRPLVTEKRKRGRPRKENKPTPLNGKSFVIYSCVISNEISITELRKLCKKDLKKRKEKSKSSIMNDEEMIDRLDENKQFSHIISFGPNNRQLFALNLSAKSDCGEMNYQFMENKHFVNGQSSGVGSVLESRRREEVLTNARLEHIHLDVKTFLDKSFHFDFCYKALIEDNN